MTLAILMAVCRLKLLQNKEWRRSALVPLKPRGLGKTKEDRPYAVLQLRQDNLIGTLFNLVGFQTNLTYAEQERVFRLIPGLEEASFVRYGLMHRNTFVNAPAVLNNDMSLKK